MPTVAVYYTLSQGSSEPGGPWARVSEAFKAAPRRGRRILRVVGTRGVSAWAECARDEIDGAIGRELAHGGEVGSGSVCGRWGGRGAARLARVGTLGAAEADGGVRSRLERSDGGSLADQ